MVCLCSHSAAKHTGPLDTKGQQFDHCREEDCGCKCYRQAKPAKVLGGPIAKAVATPVAVATVESAAAVERPAKRPCGCGWRGPQKKACEAVHSPWGGTTVPA